MYVAQYRPTAASVTCRDEDGIAATPTGSVAVTVLNPDGTTLTTGTATAGDGLGVYTYTPSTAVTDVLGAWTIRFVYTISGVQYRTDVPYTVYGGHLFEIADLRAYVPELASSADYPASEIRSARDAATDRIERAAQVAFSTRAVTVVLDGTGTTGLLLPYTQISSVNAVEIDGDPVADLTDLSVYPDGRLIWADGTVWSQGLENVVIDLEHGYETIPEPVKRATMLLAMEYLVPSALPARAMSQSTDLGEFRISLANVDAGRYTGIPEVDAVVAEFGMRRPVIQ